MLQWIPEYDRMLTEAGATLSRNPAAEVAVAVITKKGNCYCLPMNWVDHTSNENAFLGTLIQGNDTAISYITAMFPGGKLDVPYYSLAAKLAALNQQNRDALMLMQGVQRDDPKQELHYVTKALHYYTDRL